jgi:acetylornithine deacetylase/succinyl-diaminopimelate desuccinylase-like protein
LLFLVLIAPAASAQNGTGFDRASAQQQTLALLKELVSLDTQNPPGNEILVARHLDGFLKGVPGIETRILDPGDGRANFIARLRASKPTRRAVLIMGHMDVVGADTAKWTSRPFQPTERDGYLYGRGTIDDKGALAATAVAMRLLATRRDSLDRDIILLGTAAEESGGDHGIATVLGKHFDLIKDAEFALNEGGRARARRGKVSR